MGRAQRMELLFSVIVGLAPAVLMLTGGDHIYLGIWFYLGLPAVVFIIGVFCRSAPFFKLGTVLAVSVSLAGYLLWARSLPSREGLIGVPYFLAAYGLLIGSAAGALRRFRMGSYKPGALLVFGFVIATFGYLIAQALTCVVYGVCAGWPLGLLV